ncbi:MAG: hypothetical protein MZU97_19030 [Bacillus subtilis]|nr:hypothetical protein [Bacillus subtilis]
MLRTALAFGFTSVLAESSVDFFAPKSSAPRETIFDLNLVDGSILDFIARNKEYTVIGSSVDEATPKHDKLG